MMAVLGAVIVAVLAVATIRATLRRPPDDGPGPGDILPFARDQRKDGPA